jgi:hypothetical protein
MVEISRVVLTEAMALLKASSLDFSSSLFEISWLAMIFDTATDIWFDNLILPYFDGH